jgi:PAS domain S-box-containing protein
VGSFNLPALNFRQLVLPPLLGLAVFAVASFSMRFPHWTDQTSSLWLATGVSLAALLRTSRREWPLLVAVSVLGTMAASFYAMDEPWFVGVSRAANNALEYCLCAWAVRRPCGSYFDLTEPRHLAWLAGASTVSSLLKLVGTFTITHVLRTNTLLSATEVLSWAPTAIFGVFVLALPLLAMTSRDAVRSARLDWGALILLAVLAVALVLIFGPTAYPVTFALMPVMMLLGWRHGLLGAGLGAMMTIVMSLGLSLLDSGIVYKLRTMGYEAAFRGSFLEFFFIVSIASSLPLAIVRARQRATDTKLADALDATELRAEQLALSEASARRAEAQALQSEAAALLARQELVRVIETSIDIICTLDAEGHFTRISDNCLQIWGWRSEELLGRPWFDIIHEDDRAVARRNYRLRTAGKLHLPVRYRHVRSDGSAVAMFWSISWVKEDQACYCVGRDMTEQDELQERAAQSQRMDAIGQLTGGIAHDFNNLLTVILGNCQVLALKLKEEKLAALASMSARAAEQGAALIAQLLAFGRSQPLKPKRFAIDELLHSAAPLITRTLDENIELSITCCGHLRPVHADPLQTETAILNLCINARDAMPSGGKLNIEATNTTVSEEESRRQPALRTGDYVRICVTDTGTGMVPQVAERIFEPFFTTKETGKGSGLGLSMIYGFIKQSLGHIAVESEPGKGTRFNLYLPAAASEEIVDSPIPTLDIIRPGVGTVLVVEDHVLVREHARDQFESLGYDVITAENGHDAIAMLTQNEKVDLMFTDVMMSGGLSGFDLGNIVRERWPSVRILYTSGYTSEHHATGHDDLLPKPYSLASLSQKVSETLGAT